MSRLGVPSGKGGGRKGLGSTTRALRDAATDISPMPLDPVAETSTSPTYPDFDDNTVASIVSNQTTMSARGSFLRPSDIGINLTSILEGDDPFALRGLDDTTQNKTGSVMNFDIVVSPPGAADNEQREPPRGGNKRPSIVDYSRETIHIDITRNIKSIDAGGFLDRSAAVSRGDGHVSHAAVAGQSAESDTVRLGMTTGPVDYGVRSGANVSHAAVAGQSSGYDAEKLRTSNEPVNYGVQGGANVSHAAIAGQSSVSDPSKLGKSTGPEAYGKLNGANVSHAAVGGQSSVSNPARLGKSTGPIAYGKQSGANVSHAAVAGQSSVSDAAKLGKSTGPISYGKLKGANVSHAAVAGQSSLSDPSKLGKTTGPVSYGKQNGVNVSQAAVGGKSSLSGPSKLGKSTGPESYGVQNGVTASHAAVAGHSSVSDPSRLGKSTGPVAFGVQSGANVSHAVAVGQSSKSDPMSVSAGKADTSRDSSGIGKGRGQLSHAAIVGQSSSDSSKKVVQNKSPPAFSPSLVESQGKSSHAAVVGQSSSDSSKKVVHNKIPPPFSPNIVDGQAKSSHAVIAGQSSHDSSKASVQQTSTSRSSSNVVNDHADSSHAAAVVGQSSTSSSSKVSVGKGSHGKAGTGNSRGQVSHAAVAGQSSTSSSSKVSVGKGAASHGKAGVGNTRGQVSHAAVAGDSSATGSSKVSVENESASHGKAGVANRVKNALYAAKGGQSTQSSSQHGVVSSTTGTAAHSSDGRGGVSVAHAVVGDTPTSDPAQHAKAVNGAVSYGTGKNGVNVSHAAKAAQSATATSSSGKLTGDTSGSVSHGTAKSNAKVSHAAKAGQSATATSSSGKLTGDSNRSVEYGNAKSNAKVSHAARAGRSGAAAGQSATASSSSGKLTGESADSLSYGSALLGDSKAQKSHAARAGQSAAAASSSGKLTAGDSAGAASYGVGAGVSHAAKAGRSLTPTPTSGKLVGDATGPVSYSIQGDADASHAAAIGGEFDDDDLGMLSTDQVSYGKALGGDQAQAASGSGDVIRAMLHGKAKVSPAEVLGAIDEDNAINGSAKFVVAGKTPSQAPRPTSRPSVTVVDYSNDTIDDMDDVDDTEAPRQYREKDRYKVSNGHKKEGSWTNLYKGSRVENEYLEEADVEDGAGGLGDRTVGWADDQSAASSSWAPQPHHGSKRTLFGGFFLRGRRPKRTDDTDFSFFQQRQASAKSADLQSEVDDFDYTQTTGVPPAKLGRWKLAAFAVTLLAAIVGCCVGLYYLWLFSARAFILSTLDRNDVQILRLAQTAVEAALHVPQVVALATRTSASYGEIAFARDADAPTEEADVFFLDVLGQRDVSEVFVGSVDNAYSGAFLAEGDAPRIFASSAPINGTRCVDHYLTQETTGRAARLGSECAPEETPLVVSELDWFQQLNESNRTDTAAGVWLADRTLPSGTTGLTYAVPIFGDDGAVVGGTGASIDADFLSGVLDDIEMPYGVLFLLLNDTSVNVGGAARVIASTADPNGYGDQFSIWLTTNIMNEEEFDDFEPFENFLFRDKTFLWRKGDGEMLRSSIRYFTVEGNGGGLQLIAGTIFESSDVNAATTRATTVTWSVFGLIAVACGIAISAIVYKLARLDTQHGDEDVARLKATGYRTLIKVEVVLLVAMFVGIFINFEVLTSEAADELVDNLLAVTQQRMSLTTVEYVKHAQESISFAKARWDREEWFPPQFGSAFTPPANLTDDAVRDAYAAHVDGYLVELMDALQSPHNDPSYYLSGLYMGFANGDSIGAFLVNDSLSMVVQDDSTKQRADDVRGCRYVFAVGDDNQRDMTTDPVLSSCEYDARERPWYKNALADATDDASSGAFKWTSPYYFAEAQFAGVTATQVLYDNGGNVMGVMAADVVVEELSRSMHSINLGDNFVEEVRGIKHPLKDQRIALDRWSLDPQVQGSNAAGTSRGVNFSIEKDADFSIQQIGAMTVEDADCTASLWEFPLEDQDYDSCPIFNCLEYLQPTEIVETRISFRCRANKFTYGVLPEPYVIRPRTLYGVVVHAHNSSFYYNQWLGQPDGFYQNDTNIVWVNNRLDNVTNPTFDGTSFPANATKDVYSIDFGYSAPPNTDGSRLYIVERSDAKFVACSSCDVTRTFDDDVGGSVTLLGYGDESEDETIRTTTNFIIDQSRTGLQELDALNEFPRQLSAPLTLGVGLSDYGLDWATILTVPRKLFYGNMAQRRRFVALAGIGMTVIILYLLKLVYDEIQPVLPARSKAKRKNIAKKIGVENVSDQDVEGLVALVRRTGTIYRRRGNDEPCRYYEGDQLPAAVRAGHDSRECMTCEPLHHDNRNALLHMTLSRTGYNSLDYFKLHGSSTLASYIRGFHMTSAHAVLLHAVIFVHIGLQFFKPRNLEALQEAGAFPSWILLIEVVCIALEFLDRFVSTFVYLRLRESELHEDGIIEQSNLMGALIARWVLLLALLLDFVLMAAVPLTIEYYLPLRALLLIAHSAPVRRALVTLLLAIVKAKTVMLLYASLIVSSALMALVLFRRNHDDFDFTPNNFGNFAYSFITMVTYFTGGSNFSEIWYSESRDNQSYVVFFVVLAIIGLFFVMAIVVGFFKHDFDKASDMQEQHRRLISRTGIVAAFLILADRSSDGAKLKQGNFHPDAPYEKDDASRYGDATHLTSNSARSRGRRHARQDKRSRSIGAPETEMTALRGGGRGRAAIRKHVRSRSTGAPINYDEFDPIQAKNIAPVSHTRKYRDDDLASLADTDTDVDDIYSPIRRVGGGGPFFDHTHRTADSQWPVASTMKKTRMTSVSGRSDMGYGLGYNDMYSGGERLFVSKENVEAFERFCGTQMYDRSLTLKRGQKLTALEFMQRVERITVSRLKLDSTKKTLFGNASDHYNVKSWEVKDRARVLLVKGWWNQLITIMIFVSMWLSSLYGSVDETWTTLAYPDTLLAVFLFFQVFELSARFYAFGADYLFWSMYPVLWDPAAQQVRRAQLALSNKPLPRSATMKRGLHHQQGSVDRATVLQEAREMTFANRFETVVLALALVLFVVTRAQAGSFLLGVTENFARFVTVLPILRVFVRVKALRKITYVLFDVLPSFAIHFVLMLVVFYVYAVYGTANFSGEWERFSQTSGAPPQANFESLANAHVALFVFLFGGIRETMFAVVDVYGIGAVVYFLSFLFLAVLLFANLFFSLVLGRANELIVSEDEDLEKDEMQRQESYAAGMDLIAMIMEAKGKDYPLAKALQDMEDIKEGRVKLRYEQRQNMMSNTTLHRC